MNHSQWNSVAWRFGLCYTAASWEIIWLILNEWKQWGYPRNADMSHSQSGLCSRCLGSSKTSLTQPNPKLTTWHTNAEVWQMSHTDRDKRVRLNVMGGQSKVHTNKLQHPTRQYKLRSSEHDAYLHWTPVKATWKESYYAGLSRQDITAAHAMAYLKRGLHTSPAITHIHDGLGPISTAHTQSSLQKHSHHENTAQLSISLADSPPSGGHEPPGKTLNTVLPWFNGSKYPLKGFTWTDLSNDLKYPWPWQTRNTTIQKLRKLNFKVITK